MSKEGLLFFSFVFLNSHLLTSCRSLGFGEKTKKKAGGAEQGESPITADSAKKKDVLKTAESIEGFLDKAIFSAPEKTRELKAADVVQMINGEYRFFYSRPEAKISNCLEDSFQSVQLQKTSTARYRGDRSLDLTTCAQSLSGSGGIKIIRARARVLAEHWCVDSKLKLDDQAMSLKRLNANVCGPSAAFHVHLLETRYEGNSSITSEKGELRYNWVVESRTGAGDSPGACVKEMSPDGKTWAFLDCAHISKFQYTNITLNGQEAPSDKVGLFSDYQKIILNELLAIADGAPSFFERGTAKVSMNNWSGAMRYNGPSKQPEWSVTNLVGENASGTFGFVQ